MRFIVVTPTTDYNVPSGEALFWAIMSDLSMGPIVFRAGGSGLPVTSGDVYLFKALGH